MTHTKGKFVIMNVENIGEFLFWSDDWGWGSFDECLEIEKPQNHTLPVSLKRVKK